MAERTAFHKLLDVSCMMVVSLVIYYNQAISTGFILIVLFGNTVEVNSEMSFKMVMSHYQISCWADKETFLLLQSVKLYQYCLNRIQPWSMLKENHRTLFQMKI